MKIKMIALILMLFGLLFFASLAIGNQAIPLEQFTALASGSTFLEQEAGISVYAQVASTNLNNAEGAMDTVEVRTANYVIGSVDLEGYDEEYDAHIYVDTAGWVVAYYSRNAYASKIIDWVGFSQTGQLTTSKLEIALKNTCTAMYVNPSNIKYFDFRYPNANRIMIVVDEEGDYNATETFNINLPMSLVVYNRSWSHSVKFQNASAYNYYDGNIKIDDTVLNEFNLNFLSTTNAWYSWEGDVTISQLYPDVYHIVSIYNESISSTGYVGIVIIYNEE